MQWGDGESFSELQGNATLQLGLVSSSPIPTALHALTVSQPEFDISRQISILHLEKVILINHIAVSCC